MSDNLVNVCEWSVRGDSTLGKKEVQLRDGALVKQTSRNLGIAERSRSFGKFKGGRKGMYCTRQVTGYILNAAKISIPKTRIKGGQKVVP